LYLTAADDKERRVGFIRLANGNSKTGCSLILFQERRQKEEFQEDFKEEYKHFI